MYSLHLFCLFKTSFINAAELVKAVEKRISQRLFQFLANRKDLLIKKAAEEWHLAFGLDQVGGSQQVRTSVATLAARCLHVCHGISNRSGGFCFGNRMHHLRRLVAVMALAVGEACWHDHARAVHRCRHPQSHGLAA